MTCSHTHKDAPENSVCEDCKTPHKEDLSSKIKEFITKNTELREALIIEELSPFFIKDEEGKIILTQQLRVRLKEISDFKKDIREAVKKLKEIKILWSDMRITCPECEKETHMFIRDKVHCYFCEIKEIFESDLI